MEIVMNALRSKGVMTDDLEEKLSGLMSDEAKERLSGIFEKYRSLSDEEKEEFVDTVFGKLRESLQERTEAGAGLSVLQSHSYTIFFGAVFLITLVIGTCGLELL
ncbi:uncharacterized protein LOC143211432 [Lasioglossum baleicum]|uniref:uncharacterized protein LOC143211432 n=1 Tax=Lasioglossum baleicum TaxID=434251 RepID=UPI003FCE6FA5